MKNINLKAVQARGRNGWFTARDLYVYEYPREVTINIYSAKRAGTAPIVLNFQNRDDLQRVADEINQALANWR